MFSDPSSLANPVETVHLPALIVLHHIVVGSSFRLPHEVHGWSEAEYALWTQKHTDETEQWALLESAIEGQLTDEAKNGQGEDGMYLKLIRDVLGHARHDDHTPMGS